MSSPVPASESDPLFVLWVTWGRCPFSQGHQWQHSCCFFHTRTIARGSAATDQHFNNGNGVPGKVVGKAWEHIPKPIGKPKPFLCFEPFYSSCQEAAFTAATKSLQRKENNCGRLFFFFPLQVTASILADSYLFSATSHLPKHYQKCSNYCQLSLDSHGRQGQAGRPPDSWMLNSDESFG